jgi:hypothetical protein
MEITKSEKSEDLIIYTNRRGIMPMLIIIIICFIFILLFIVFIGISMFVYPEQRNGGTVFALIVMLGFGTMCFWLIQSLIGLLSPSTPMLVINHEGIRVGTKTYGSTEFVLPWEEIEAIYILGNMFCIRPTNKKRLLSHFRPIKRLLLRVTFPKDIYVTQFYLEKPVLGIFEQLGEKYAYELDSYYIRLQP